MKKSQKIVFFVIGIVLVSAAVAVVMVKREPWISAEAAFKKGQTNLEKGAYKKAFQYLKMAADKDPGNAAYAWTTVKMAAALQNPNAAYLYAQKAWKNGRKERDVLNALVQFSFFSDAKQKMDYALSLVDQMGDNVVKDDIRAEVYVSFGDRQKARQLWEQLFSNSPVPATASKLGRLYLQTRNDSLAFSFLQSCRTQQKLDDQGYGMLAGLYAKRGDVKEAERCFQEAGEGVTTSSDQLNYNHAAFLMGTKNFDRATSMLDSLTSKYPENKNYETLRMSVLFAKGDFNGVLQECGKSSAPIGVTAAFRGRALVRLNRLAEAETAFDTAVAHLPDLRVRVEFGNMLLYALHKSEKARTMFQAVYKAAPQDPLANLGLATLAVEAKDITGARKYLDAVMAMKKNIPYGYLLLAQINLIEGKPQDALENCGKVLSMIPGFEKALVLQAQAYLRLGQPDKTAEMYTSLSSAAKNDTAKSNMFRRAIIPIRIQQKKFDEALKLVDGLDRGASTVETRRIRFEINAVRGNIARANELLASLKPDLAKKDFLYYQSWLAELSGDTAKAAAVLEDGLLSKNLALRWAGLRVKLGKTDDVMGKLPVDSLTASDWLRLLSIAENRRNYPFCVECYKKALKLDAENATLLNNYAWASMQIPGFDREEVLKTAKKAFMLLSGKPEVLQTYAEALNKCGKPVDCIKLLQDKPAIVKQSANLLYQLGNAYEATSDLRGAVSSYKLALSFPESTSDWPAGVDRKELSARMEQLKGKVVSSQ